MRPRPADPADFPEYIQFLVDVSYPRSAEERATDAPIQEKFQGRHNIPTPSSCAAPGFPADITLEQYEEYMDHFIDERLHVRCRSRCRTGATTLCNRCFDRVENFNRVRCRRNRIAICRSRHLTTFETARSLCRQARRRFPQVLQSMNAFGEDPANVEKYYELGLEDLRSFTLQPGQRLWRLASRVERRWHPMTA